MKIAVIGTAGIPGRYGGFETLAEHLTRQLGSKLDFTVFCSSKNYNIKFKNYNNAKLKYLPIDANGSQSIIYDIISLFSAAFKHDTILILGVSGCIILPLFRLLFPYHKLLINIDGLEHRREKWKKAVKAFLKFSELQAVKYADTIITDNEAIRDYVLKVYKKDSILIAYGGNHAKKSQLTAEIKNEYSLPENYAFKVCRIEPENNIHLVLDAFSKINYPLIIIGNWQKSNYGISLKEKFAEYSHIYLLEPIYEQNILDQLRSNCTVYIHGHSAGGTNPSLVEAMALGLPVIAYDVIYNRKTTFNKALFFKNSEDLQLLINEHNFEELLEIGKAMEEIAKNNYTWEKIAKQYYSLFQNLSA